MVDIEVKAGDSELLLKDQVVSPAIPMGRLLGWIDQLSLQRKAIDTGETYRGSDPAPVQVLALEAKKFELDVPWSVPLMAKSGCTFSFCHTKRFQLSSAKSKSRSIRFVKQTPSSVRTSLNGSLYSIRRYSVMN